MRSRALADGKMPAKCVPSASDGDKVLARCVPGRFAVARFRRGAFPGGNPWQFFHSMYPKRGLGRENRPFLARFARHTSEMSWLWQDMRAMYPKSPANRRQRIRRAKILPGRGTFRCTGPSNHARRANLAIRRQTARAIATTAPPLWRGRTGRERLLVGGGGAAEGVRGVVGCRALTEKPASAKRRLWVSDADRLAESRKPAFAGRAQGGAAARRRRSSGPAERGLLAVRAKGCFGSAQAMPPTSMTRRSRARNSQRSAR